MGLSLNDTTIQRGVWVFSLGRSLHQFVKLFDPMVDLVIARSGYAVDNFNNYQYTQGNVLVNMVIDGLSVEAAVKGETQMPYRSLLPTVQNFELAWNFLSLALLF